MSVQARPQVSHFDSSRYHGLNADQLIRMYRIMYASRRLDDPEMLFKQQNKDLFPNQRGRARGRAGGQRRRRF